MRLSGLLGEVIFAFALSLSSLAATVCSEAELRTALAVGGTINFGCDTELILSAPLQVTSDTVLDGSGRDITISGNGAVRVFEVANGVSFTLQNVRIINGYVKGADEVSTPTVIPAADAFAAGLAATNAIIVLQDCTFSNNVALGGTAQLNVHADRAGEAYGGAVYALGGELNVINSKFLTNSATGGMIVNIIPGIGNMGQARDGDAWGGAIWISGARLRITGSVFSENAAVNGGGAIYTRSNEVAITTTTFNTNSVSARHSARNVGNLESDGLGGAMELRSVISMGITNSIFAGNFVTGGGGYGGSSKTLGGGALYSDSNLSISDSDFIRNSVQGSPAPYPILISRGGALLTEAATQISGVRFVGNAVSGADSVVFALGGNPAGDALGGALFVSGQLHVSESGFISNRAQGGVSASFSGPLRGAAQGGAIYSSNGIFATNLTIAQNFTLHAAEHPQGVAVYCAGSGAALSNTIQFCTFATNQYQALVNGATPFQLSHAGSASNAVIHLRGTIFSGGTSNTITGAFIDDGHNITSDNLFTHVTSKNNTDPMFGPLGYYGGRSETIPVLAASPAVNAVNADFPPIDQRGRARPHGSGAEIGAYEVSPPFAAMGRLRREIDYSQTQLSVDGAQFEIATDRTFLVFFSNAGPLTPSSSRVIFDPATIQLEPGIERFDLTFTGYALNEVAVENHATVVTITFAAETAGNYELLSSANLAEWNPVETITLTANALYRKEITATDALQFYRVHRE